MTDPSASPEQLAQLSAEVAKYIRNQRDKYRPAALPLSSEQKNAMSGYFSSDLLSNVRWLSLIDEVVETSTFFVVGLDLVDPSAFSMMAAITFLDVIVANVPLWFPFTPPLTLTLQSLQSSMRWSGLSVIELSEEF